MQPLREREEAARCKVAALHQEMHLMRRAPAEALEELEKHLIRLSDNIRRKDIEISQMQRTIHKECIERTQMMAYVEQLEGRLRGKNRN